MKKYKLAIIGCGAVAEKGHLPAINNNSDAEVVALVDKNINRAKEIGKKFEIDSVFDDYTEIYDIVDGAIVALPHFLHAPVCVDLLNHGIHTLVEKPMALNVAECEAMLQAANKRDAILSVGNMRRYLPSHQFVKKIIDKGIIGKIVSFDIREGNVYNWPVASDFFFKKNKAGGGVLFDTGAHTIDSVLWWLGNIDEFDYYDDSQGGVEADCIIYATMKSGADGIIELSRTRDLRNSAIIKGEYATVEVDLRRNHVILSLNDNISGIDGNSFSEEIQEAKDIAFNDLFVYQLADWLNSIKTGKPSLVSGTEAKRSVCFIEECYKNRQDLNLPWI